MNPPSPSARPERWNREALLRRLEAQLPDQVGPAELEAALADLGLAPSPAVATAAPHARSALRGTARRMLTALADALPVGVCAVTSTLEVIVFNRAARSLLELPDELFAEGLPPFRDLLLFNARRGEYGPGDPEALTDAIMDKARRMQPHHFQRTRPNGTVLDVHGATMHGGGFCTIWTDITELQKAHAQAQQRATELRDLIDSAPGTIGCIDRDGVVRMANRRLVALLHRHDAADVEGHTLRELLGDERYAMVAEPFARAQAGEVICYRREHVQPDGSRAWLQVHLQPRCDADGQPDGLYTMGADITALVASERVLQERNQRLEALNAKLEAAQSQLMQAEKLASIGQLAAGVAHEINNPVGFVSSNANTLERYVHDLFGVIGAYAALEPLVDPEAPELMTLAQVKRDADLDFLNDDLRELIAQSRDGLGRVKKIVQDLKDFSHADTEHRVEAADLERCLDSTLNIAANEIKYKARVIKDYGHPPLVECVPSQLNQVFLNLIVNAGHAIEQQGTITVRTGTEDDQAWVEVEDSGSGMDAATLQRAFEPFFTTKPVGKGTGLGLSLSYGIVHKHHGRIEVDSVVGRGTRMRVWLPLVQPAAVPAAA